MGLGKRDIHGPASKTLALTLLTQTVGISHGLRVDVDRGRGRASRVGTADPNRTRSRAVLFMMQVAAVPGLCSQTRSSLFRGEFAARRIRAALRTRAPLPSSQSVPRAWTDGPLVGKGSGVKPHSRYQRTDARAGPTFAATRSGRGTRDTAIVVAPTPEDFLLYHRSVYVFAVNTGLTCCTRQQSVCGIIIIIIIIIFYFFSF